MSTLADAEAKIDLKVVHSSDDPERSTQFKETAIAIFEIIEHKLYRERQMNIETYFKTFWKISRAQAYRMYNCGAILLELSDFDVWPARERYCRILKKLAKTKEERRKLWAETLRAVSGNQQMTITSNLITNVWSSIMKKEGEPYKTASAPVFSTASNSSSAAGRQQQETSFQIRQGPSNEGPNSRSSSTTNGGGSGEDPLRNLSMVATNLMEQQEKEDRTARQRPTLPPPFQPQPMMMYQARPPMMNQMPRPPVVIHQQQETPAFPNFSTFHHNPIERHRVRPYSVPVNIPLSQMQQQQMQHQQQQQHHQPRPGLNYRFIHPGEPQPIFVPASQTSISNPPGYVPSYLDARFKSHPLITETRYRDKVPDRNEGSNAGSIDADSFKDSMESVDASIQLESLTPPFEKTNDQHQTAHVTAPAPMHPKFEKAAIYPTPNSASADSPMVANDDNNDVKKKGKTSNPDLRFILNSSSSPRTSLEDDV